MPSFQDQADSVRSAVSSISTCSPATAVLLKDLVLPGDAGASARADGAESRASKTSRVPKLTATSGRAPAKKSTKSAAAPGLSAKEKAVLATHVINASLKALGDAAKPAAAPAPQRQPQAEGGELVRKASRNALRRSLSAPPTPLQSRTLNRVATSPLATAKQPTRPASSGSGSSSCLSLVECARIAFTALRGLQNAGEITLPELQLESGMSSLVARLIALGMLEQAVKELRLLKQRLDSYCGVSATAKKPTKAAALSDGGSAARFSDILDFRGLKTADGPVANLVITTQLQALRILSMMKKPQLTESVVGVLKDTTGASPTKLLVSYAGSSAANRDKASRQLETLSQLLLSLTPSVSSKSDDEALEPKLSVSPSAAFDMQVLGLESRLQWWAIAGHKGDVDKDVVSPFSRCLAAYIRRAGPADEALYTKCVDSFVRIQDLVKRQSTSPATSSKSPLASLYQSLGALAREARQYPKAIEWTSRLKGLMRAEADSEASRCSVDALLLSLQLKDPSLYLESDKLIEDVTDGIQGVLKGDSAELEALLANVGLARRSAMSLLVAQNREALAAEHTLRLLESFVLQCPRFCLRWLGKPPASNGSTKDFLRYEQRRQILMKSIHHFLDSAFMVNKTLIDEKRVSWTQMDSVLGDCLTLLDYMGDVGNAESASSSSHHVKISHFYFMQYSLLRQSCKDPKSPEPMRALRRSIECVKQRSAREKDKSQLIMKLERIAEAYKSLGRIGEALGALQSIRSSLVDDGLLADIVQCLEERSPVLAWTRTNQASTLSRTLVSIAKLEQVPMNWSVDLSEPEQLAVREHWLHFVILGGSKDRPRPTLADECVESLLKTYYPTRFPVKRLRTLLSLLAVNMDCPDQFAAIESQIDAVVGLIKGGGCAEDMALEPYLDHYCAYHKSLVGLRTVAPDLDQIESALAQWHGVIRDCKTLEDLDRVIDNPTALLGHLQSLADFARTMGHDSVQLSALELSAKVSSISATWSAEDKITSDSSLALLYANTGQCAMAEKVLEDCQRYTLEEAGSIPAESMADLHLAYAEYYILTGNLDKAEAHFNEARAHATSDSPSGSQPPRSRRRDLISYASLLQSMIASKKGEPHHALVHARETVRVLFRDWSRLEQMSKPQQTVRDAADVSIEGSPAAEPTALVPAGPEFWKLFHPLFRSMSHLSSIYAHLGMFQETVYYAEQAQKIAQSTNARLYLAECEAWLASVHLKAGKLDRSLELANLSSSRLRDTDCTTAAVTLACQLGGLYRDLKEFHLEQNMIDRAEAAMKRLKEASGAAESEIPQESANPPPEEKPKRQLAKRAPSAASTAKKTTTRKAAATAKPKAQAPAVELASAPAASDIVISSLATALMVHRAISLVNNRDWAAAMTLLQQSQALAKLGKSKLGEMVARATCFFGQCREQMMRDAVYSVIQDSTLSFPAVSSASAEALVDRLALVKTSPPKKGRGAAGAAAAARQPEFVENLQAAHDCLVQAHAVAMVSGDGAMVHRIAGMLQSTMLLLSAACPSRPRVMGNQSFATCSVEAAQNLTWRRERKALLLEKSGYKNDGLDWPISIGHGEPDSSPGPRSGPGAPLADMGRFQKDYIDIIPKDWTVISVSLSDNKHDLCVSRLQAGHSPFVIRLPLERGSSRDSANDSFNYHQGRAELLEIIRLANESSHDARDMSRKGAKTQWWAEREALDRRLGELLDNIEQVWLGGFKGIFSPQRRNPELLVRFQKSFHDILDKHLPSRRQVRGRRTKAAAATPAPAKVTLDPRILELFVGLADVTDPDCGDLDDALNDLLYFVVDILQFHGERNAYDEIDFDSMCVETFDMLHSYHTTAAEKQKKKKISSGRRGAAAAAAGEDEDDAQGQQHTVLVLDKALHVFPWESIPCMQGQAVSRVPSLECLRRLILDQRRPKTDASSALSGHHASRFSGAYMLNPEGDLKSTQATFEKPLASALLGSSNDASKWTGTVAKPPAEAEFEQALRTRDVVLYFGHGSGAQYVRGRTVRRLDGGCRAAVLLWGCSSASLADVGDFETHGPVWNYLMAGCPAVVGTLWDVTDRDIDRLAGRALEEWGLLDKGTFAEDKEKAARTTAKGRDASPPPPSSSSSASSLVEAVARAKDVCRFRYLTAAAVCVYGIPVYLTDNETTAA